MLCVGYLRVWERILIFAETNIVVVMTIAVFGNSSKKNTLNEVAHILAFMDAHHVQVLLSQELRNEMNLRDKYAPYTHDVENTIDFALSVGGDGTFLYSVSQVIDKNIPILGINCGHLGFLTEVQALG